MSPERRPLEYVPESFWEERYSQIDLTRSGHRDLPEAYNRWLYRRKQAVLRCALARHLDVPEEICRRPPTTDTFSMPQTQEEFYFALPYDRMDLCLHARNHNVPAAEVAPAVGLTAEQVERVYKDIEAKRRATRYLHEPPLVVECVAEVCVPCAE